VDALKKLLSASVSRFEVTHQVLVGDKYLKMLAPFVVDLMAYIKASNYMALCMDNIYPPS